MRIAPIVWGSNLLREAFEWSTRPPVSLFFLTRNLKSMSFLRDKWVSVLNHFHRRVVDGLIKCHLRALDLFYKERPDPLKYWQFFYWPVAIFSGCSDPLFPNEDRLRTSGKSLSIPPLKELLRHDILRKVEMQMDHLWRSVKGCSWLIALCRLLMFLNRLLIQSVR